MPLMIPGVYLNCREDRPYEIETTHQLEYYISSALITVESILDPIEEVIKRFDNLVKYYRYYVDSLFYYLGLINDRFICKPCKNGSKLQEKKKERIDLNKRNYQFTEQDFKILSSKMSRNVIEHLDERNAKTILENKGVGGFNVIFADSDSNMVNSILTQREYYPYNLDLINNRILFYNIQNKAEDEKKFDVDIFELQKELHLLLQHVNEFGNIMKVY